MGGWGSTAVGDTLAVVQNNNNKEQCGKKKQEGRKRLKRGAEGSWLGVACPCGRMKGGALVRPGMELCGCGREGGRGAHTRALCVQTYRAPLERESGGWHDRRGVTDPGPFILIASSWGQAGVQWCGQRQNDTLRSVSNRLVF
eukprot:GGOE01023224.1.p3 GENE.GGOE01023224.1~~GGOE01023224.1.p3  ORF type:complete len:143 (+),score=1.87 GGOE01023224.1:696-1124(+)